ncbi:MAG: sodium:solute symporter [Streptosporangiales bacterium]|nr:sodium:solute symporter [Streptosporangiales bacterium]
MPQVLDTLIIVAYFAVIVGAGIWGLRRARSAEDFLVAGRRLGPVMYVGTLSAVVLGGASTIGGVGLGYQYGISGMWLVFMIGLGVMALGVLMSTRLSRLGVVTVSQALEQRYGPAARLTSAVVMAAYALMVAVTSTIAIGSVFDVVLGVNATLAIIIAGGIVVAYSVAGGMWSITLTDVIQFWVMTAGIFLALLPITVNRAGGLSGLQDSLPESYFDLGAIGGQTIVTYFLLYFFGMMIGQDIWQRLFTARSPRVARWGTIAAGGYCVLYAIAGALIGAAAKALLPDLGNPDNAFAAVAADVLPMGISGLVLAAALAAVMSTASATLLASSTLLANDVYGASFARGPYNRVAVNRIVLVLAGVATLVVSVLVSDVVGALTVAYDLLTGALFVPIVGALFWRRATTAGAVSAIAVAGVVVVILMAVRGLDSNDPIIYGMAVNLVVFVVVSLLTKPADPAAIAAWHRRLAGEPVPSADPEPSP